MTAPSAYQHLCAELTTGRRCVRCGEPTGSGARLNCRGAECVRARHAASERQRVARRKLDRERENRRAA